MSVQIPHDEEDTIRARFWHPRSGDVVFDIGSFMGTYTIPALFADAIVYAVDGRQHTLLALHEFAQMNGVTDDLTLLHRTVYDGGPYPAELNAQIVSSRYESSREMLPVGPPTTIDRLAAEFALATLDLVKVDVEGGELGVLRGATKTLRELRPVWLIEDHSRVYPWVAEQQTTSQLTDLLERADYDVEFVAEPYVDYVIGRPQ